VRFAAVIRVFAAPIANAAATTAAPTTATVWTRSTAIAITTAVTTASGRRGRVAPLSPTTIDLSPKSGGISGTTQGIPRLLSHLFYILSRRERGTSRPATLLPLPGIG